MSHLAIVPSRDDRLATGANMSNGTSHPADSHIGDSCYTSPFPRRGRWIFWAFAIIAAVFLVVEHRAHLLGVLPFLFLAACPLMHLFMHGKHGHGGHDHSQDHQSKD